MNYVEDVVHNDLPAAACFVKNNEALKKILEGFEKAKPLFCNVYANLCPIPNRFMQTLELNPTYIPVGCAILGVITFFLKKASALSRPARVASFFIKPFILIPLWIAKRLFVSFIYMSYGKCVI